MVIQKKSKEYFECNHCGYKHSKWFGRCPKCNERCDPQRITVTKSYKPLRSKMPQTRKPTTPVEKEYVCEHCGYTQSTYFCYCSYCGEKCDFQQKQVNKKSKSKKQATNKPVDKEKAFSVFTDDLYHCIITGDGGKGLYGIHVHHIFGGANKKNSEKYGFLIPLRNDWHSMSNYGIHNDRELDLKYKRLCQEYWLEHYGTQEEFIKVFGQWW